MIKILCEDMKEKEFIPSSFFSKFTQKEVVAINKYDDDILKDLDILIISSNKRLVSNRIRELVIEAEAENISCFYVGWFNADLSLDEAKHIMSHSVNPQLGCLTFIKLESVDIVERNNSFFLPTIPVTL